MGPRCGPRLAELRRGVPRGLRLLRRLLRRRPLAGLGRPLRLRRRDGGGSSCFACLRTRALVRRVRFGDRRLELRERRGQVRRGDRLQRRDRAVLAGEPPLPAALLRGGQNHPLRISVGGDDDERAPVQLTFLPHEVETTNSTSLIAAVSCCTDLRHLQGTARGDAARKKRAANGEAAPARDLPRAASGVVRASRRGRCSSNRRRFSRIPVCVAAARRAKRPDGRDVGVSRRRRRVMPVLLNDPGELLGRSPVPRRPRPRRRRASVGTAPASIATARSTPASRRSSLPGRCATISFPIADRRSFKRSIHTDRVPLWSARSASSLAV